MSFLMGQTLSEPVTEKQSSTISNEFVKVGTSCMQGWRATMEDYHTVLLSLPGDESTCFFAVYDGHGGSAVAQYAETHIRQKLTRHPAYRKGNLEEAIKATFLEIDQDMRKDMKNEVAGSTAIVVLIKDGVIYCGNVGDSRAIASKGGHVDELSFDHKPDLEKEKGRILSAGGWVEFNRVNGSLALSRALGDFVFKNNVKKRPEEQIVTACPDVIIKSLTSDHEFILLACDGIWEVLSNEEVVAFIRCRIAEGIEPEEICEDLMSTCLAPYCQLDGVGCDNMTVVLVCLLQGGTYKELAARCAQSSHPTAENQPTGSNCTRCHRHTSTFTEAMPHECNDPETHNHHHHHT